MQQAQDFLDESDALTGLVEGWDDAQFTRETQFKRWSVNDVFVHLYFWNRAADLALVDPEGFTQLYGKLRENLAGGTLRAFENSYVTKRGRALFSLWQAQCRDMAERWQKVDPKHRVKWAGPEMSTRSSMSARQMETWAHSQCLFDLAGKERIEKDRIKNIVILGVNAFGWSHKVHALELPPHMPKLKLSAPSGEVWTFGDNEQNAIEGEAVEFCQVVTQTRNVLDTDLRIEGEAAQNWMKHAQCFAGPPETPPRAGERHISKARF